MTRQTALLLRLEGLVVLLGALGIHRALEGSWLLFAVLFLAPDLFMLGYLKDRRVGAAVYNVGHTYVAPGLLAGVALGVESPVAAQVALIWAAHIGVDRLLGFGLKRPTAFRDTHLDPATEMGR